MLTSIGEPDANHPGLRLWLRADAGIKDSQGKAPGDADFLGDVATWSDQSPRHFDLKAPMGQGPTLVAHQPAIGKRPTVAFGGNQILLNRGSPLHSRASSTVLLVLQVVRPTSRENIVYCVGNPNGKQDRLAWVHGDEHDDSLGYLQWRFPATRGESSLENPLQTPADGRFAVVVLSSYGDATTIEVHDGYDEMLGGQRATVGRDTAVESQHCGNDFTLGGLMPKQPETSYNGQIAEVLVYDVHLTFTERRKMLAYLRRKYQLDPLDALIPPDTFLLQAEDFDGAWQDRSRWDALSPMCLGGHHVWADDKAAAEGIKAAINVARQANYYVWVRAVDSGRESAIRTSIQGKQLSITHNEGPLALRWRLAGKAELQPGPTEIVLRGEGPGGKDCDAVLISPAAATLNAVEDVCALAQRLRQTPSPGRVTALFDSGPRLDGDAVEGWRWSKSSGPAGASGGAVQCLRLDSRIVEKTCPADSDFEFQNGDQIYGTICGYVAATSQSGTLAPAHLLVRPPAEFFRDAEKTIGINTDWLRRIVFERTAVERRCPPRTVICRDGRQFAFRALRWSGEGVSLLTEEGITRIALRDLAEVRLESRDPWVQYYRELAAIDPSGDVPIVRLTTQQGSVFTSTAKRFAPLRDEGEAAATRLLLQPAWSLTPIPVPWSIVRTQWRGPAEIVPLSRIAPEQIVQHGALGSSWRWQLDRSVAGGELQSGGLRYLWGFGVHAPNALVFPLPSCARAFRATLGIDASVGDAGCVVARVYANKIDGPPLYQSKPLLGSRTTLSCGEIPLVAGGQMARRLVLMADEAGDARPPGAAPLDIGGHFDWLEPVLLLDTAKLCEEVARHRVAP